MRRLLAILLIPACAISTIISCQNAGELKQGMYYVNGRDLYIRRCQNCHGISGEGLGMLAPPLTDTIFLKLYKQRLACLIKNGNNDTLIVHGKAYEGKMPANPDLANIDIAQLIVYITNTYGNSQGMYDPEQVADDLKHCTGQK